MDLGTLPPGKSASRQLKFSDRGTLVLQARFGDRALEETVESSVTGSLGATRR